MKRITSYPKGLDIFQKISVTLMAFFVLLTFVGANLHAVMWQQSTWLVSTVLPAVVVNLTNEEREDASAPILQRNATLDRAAKLKAQHMANNEYFSHFSPDGVSPWYWFDQAGYSYAHAGENLAIHFTDSSEVVEAWMKSPTHRANIVNSDYLEIGVGTAQGTYDGFDTVYVVQLFGTQTATVVPSVVSTPEQPVSVQVETSQQAELAEIQASLNELSEVVAELDSTDVVAVNSEEQQVLAESIETPEEIVVEETLVPDAISKAATSEFAVEEQPTPQEILVVESTIATSSGLAAATVVEQTSMHAGATVVSMITQPNQMLQWAYILLGMLVMTLLLFSAIFEARKLHYMQVAYSAALMLSMGGLWYVHSLLTSGAVIV